jgi:proline dehydrogenase
MKRSVQPIPKNLTKLEAMAKSIQAANQQPVVDFQNTEIAFAGKSEKELRKAARLFGVMNNHWLVGVGAKLGITAIKMHLPFVESMVKSTIFEQFCGGTTLLECQKTVHKLYEQKALTILDYGAEAKESEADFNHTMNETIRAIEFAAQEEAIVMLSSKITGMARFGLLELISQGGELTPELRIEYRNVLKRIDAVCYTASQKGMSVSFDAEESWIQNAIDHLVNIMMRRYNKDRVVVYNTYQLYRTDRLQYIIDSFNQAQRGEYLLGAKLVRGAYMERERNRAEQMGYPSPIQVNKEATDDAYNMALRFCIDNYEHISVCNATHNAESSLLMAQLIDQKRIARNHPHLLFSQLLGMSDNITFNLSHAGFNAAKYVPYGPVKDVVPYLIRRAEENSSVTGDMSREYQLVQKEMKRRELA